MIVHSIAASIHPHFVLIQVRVAGGLSLSQLPQGERLMTTSAIFPTQLLYKVGQKAVVSSPDKQGKQWLTSEI